LKSFILADNQDITRCGLLSLLAELGFADSATEACSRDELKQQLDARPNARVVLDYTLFDVSDFQLLNLRERYRLSHWLLFSDELSKHFLRQVLQSGQQFGVVMKSDGRDDIFYALQCASRGETYLCDTARQVLREGVPTRAEHDRLTASEILVLHEIAIGKTTKEIAA
jgi:DNA-binding NarL/FixJ family response regulator